MSQYWSIDELENTALNLWNEQTRGEGITQQDVVTAINRDREHHGLDTVSRQAVTRAIDEGGRRYAMLLADVVDALLTISGRLDRAETGRPKMYVRWIDDDSDHPPRETETPDVDD